MNQSRLGRSLAIGICIIPAAALAVSQAFVVMDMVMRVHPHWPAAAQWSMAIGFEGAILATGLAMAMTGFARPLVAAEVFLVTMSVLAGTIVVYDGHVPSWLITASVSAMPLQYLAVTFAAHRLHGHYAGLVGGQAAMSGPATSQSVARTRAIKDTPKLRSQRPDGHQQAANLPVLGPLTDEPEDTVRDRGHADVVMPDGRRDKAALYATMAKSVGDNADLVADMAMVSKRTARRWRRDAQALGLL